MVLVGTMSGDFFFLVQLVYKETTKPLSFLIQISKWPDICNHWCNEKTMLDYVHEILSHTVQKSEVN